MFGNFPCTCPTIVQFGVPNDGSDFHVFRKTTKESHRQSTYLLINWVRSNWGRGSRSSDAAVCFRSFYVLLFLRLSLICYLHVYTTFRLSQFFERLNRWDEVLIDQVQFLRKIKPSVDGFSSKSSAIRVFALQSFLSTNKTIPRLNLSDCKILRTHEPSQKDFPPERARNHFQLTD